MSASARGSKHERTGEPNEDSHRAGHANGRAIVAVADGHGSPSCPRAVRGSEFAVNAMFDVLEGDLDRPTELLGEHLVESWRDLVEADLRKDPPHNDDDEETSIPNYLLYGTTAIGVAADGSTITVVQIGDGDVLLGARDTPTARRPIPRRELSRPGATESLCQSDAASRVIAASIDTSTHPVDVVLIGTDGLDTAFADDAWHDETVADLLERLAASEAPEVIADSLLGWCESPATVGGDDTTIGLIVHSGLWTEEEK